MSRAGTPPPPADNCPSMPAQSMAGPPTPGIWPPPGQVHTAGRRPPTDPIPFGVTPPTNYLCWPQQGRSKMGGGPTVGAEPPCAGGLKKNTDVADSIFWAKARLFKDQGEPPPLPPPRRHLWGGGGLGPTFGGSGGSILGSAFRIENRRYYHF